jgi:hypothetical protein
MQQMGRGATPLGGFADLKEVASHGIAVPLRRIYVSQTLFELVLF